MKAIGIVNIAWSGINILGALISLVIIWVEKMIFSRSPLMNEINLGFDFTSYMNTIFDIILIFTPLTLIVFSFLLIGGIKILKLNNDGIRYTKIAAISIIMWYIVYMVYSFYSLVPVFQNVPNFNAILSIIIAISIIMGLIFVCGYPIFLLIYLRNRTTIVK